MMGANEHLITAMDAELDEKYGEERLAMTRDFRDKRGHALEWVEVRLNPGDPKA